MQSEEKNGIIFLQVKKYSAKCEKYTTFSKAKTKKVLGLRIATEKLFLAHNGTGELYFLFFTKLFFILHDFKQFLAKKM